MPTSRSRSPHPSGISKGPQGLSRSPDGKATVGTRLPISGAFLELLSRGVSRRGVDQATVWSRSGLPVPLNDPSRLRLSSEQLARFLTVMTRLTRDEFWGICSTPVPLGTFKTLCRLLAGCRTLGDAVSAGCHFYRLIVGDFALRLRNAGGTAVVAITDDLGDAEQRRAVHGPVVFILFHMMCWLVDRRLPLIRVDFAFPARPNSEEVARTYHRALVTFDAPRTSLTLDAHWLSLPIVPDEARLSEFLAQIPRNLILAYRDETSTADQVRSILRRNLAVPLSLEAVAAKLNVSAPTLRRRLVDGGQQGFRQLQDRVRHEAAIDLLQNPHRSIDEVATLLGFAEPSAFHRAFKRWTGKSPGSLRREGG